MLNFKRELQTINIVTIAVKSRLCQDMVELAKYAEEKSTAKHEKDLH